jgi:hypothetical protein
MECFLKFAAPSPTALPKLTEKNKTPTEYPSRPTKPVGGSVDGRPAIQQPASEPRAGTSFNIWAAISSIQLFACHVCERFFGGCYKDAKINIVARELDRIFKDPANLINCKEDILLWQGELRKLGCNINQEEIKEILLRMPQKNLSILSDKFGGSTELQWFVNLLQMVNVRKGELKSNFENDLSVHVEGYFSLPFGDAGISQEAHNARLCAIEELIKNSNFASCDELRKSIGSVLLKMKKKITLRHLSEGMNNVQIAKAFVEDLKKIADDFKREGSKNLPTEQPSFPNQEPGSRRRVGTPEAKIVGSRSQKSMASAPPADLSKTVSSYVKNVVWALLKLNAQSQERDIERAANNLIMLSLVVGDEVPLKKIQDELKRQFKSLNDSQRKNLLASIPLDSGRKIRVGLTDTTIRSSIMMKINQPALDLASKHSGKSYDLNKVQEKVNAILDTIMSLETEQSYVPVRMKTGSSNMDSHENMERLLHEAPVVF